MLGRAFSPASFACFPTRPKSFWPFAAGGREEQELAYVDGQCGSQSIKQIDRRIELAGFNLADRPTIDSSVESEALLTDPLCGSNTSKIPCDAVTSVHAEDATKLQLTNLSDIADIFGKSVYLSRRSASKEMLRGAVPQTEVIVRFDVDSGEQK